MKTIKINIAAVLTFQAAVLFASNDIISTPSANTFTTTSIIALNPATPVEATFEEETIFDVNQLVPVIPAEATFEDASIDMISTLNLAPVVTQIADFEDAIDVTVDISALAPITSFEPEFE